MLRTQLHYADTSFSNARDSIAMLTPSFNIAKDSIVIAMLSQSMDNAKARDRLLSLLC